MEPTLGRRRGPAARFSTDAHPGVVVTDTYDAGVAILIDPPRPEAHGRRWSHLVSDTSLAELHAFADACGMPRRAFEGDHYDVPEERYAAVVAAGARPTPARDLLRALQASGLRMQKRRGDTGVVRASGVRFVDGTSADVDLIRSAREADPSRVFAAMAFVRDAEGDFAVVHSIRRGEWGAPGGWREGESLRAPTPFARFVRRPASPSRRRPWSLGVTNASRTARRSRGCGGRGSTCSRSTRRPFPRGGRDWSRSSTTPPTGAG